MWYLPLAGPEIQEPPMGAARLAHFVMVLISRMAFGYSTFLGQDEGVGLLVALSPR